MDTPQHFVFFGTTIYNTCQSNRTRQIALTIARRGHNVTFVELPSLRASLSGPMRPRRTSMKSFPAGISRRSFWLLLYPT